MCWTSKSCKFRKTSWTRAEYFGRYCPIYIKCRIFAFFVFFLIWNQPEKVKNLRNIFDALRCWCVHVLRFTFRGSIQWRNVARDLRASYSKYGDFVTTVILNNNLLGAIFVNLERKWSCMFWHQGQHKMPTTVCRK